MGCDSEKFFSSYYGDLSGYDSTAVFGYVYRWDNGKPIAGAFARVDLNKSKTDQDGYFYLNVLYSQDINRNLLIPIVVSAKNFEPQLSRIQILFEPVDVGSFMLVWAVPVIETAYITYRDGYRIQAWVKDYQGAETIKSVFGQLKRGPILSLYKMYERILIDSERALWESDPLPFNYDGPLVVYAEEGDGHRDTLWVP